MKVAKVCSGLRFVQFYSNILGAAGAMSYRLLSIKTFKSKHFRYTRRQPPSDYSIGKRQNR